MDPLWLSIGSILFVIVSVLALRLHPFLALTFAALLVAICTPPEQIRESYLEDVSQRVTSLEDGRVVVAGGDPHSGRHMVFRPSSETGRFEAVGEIFLQAQRLVPVGAQPGFALQPGDRIVAESAMAGIAAKTQSSPGERLAAGFGDTCRKIGILIAMASIIGTCLLESGAARKIVDATRNLVGERRTPLAFAISGFIVGIPVFFDTVFYLLMPLAKAMYRKTGKNYLLYVMSIVVGATMAHSLIPPTPGPLFVASKMGINIGTMIVAGTLVGLVAVASGFAYALWANQRWEIPLRDDEVRTAESEAGEVTGPPVYWALLPIVIPVLFLSGKTFFDAWVNTLGARDQPIPDWITRIQPTLNFFGDKNVALVVAAVVALVMLAAQRRRAGVEPWLVGIQQALSSGGVIILITASGGAFGSALRQCGIASAIQERFPVAESGLMLLVIAFAITAIVRFAQGSATVAMITSVSIVAPLISQLSLPYHPVYLALAIGCGSKPFPWMNDSGFWIVGKMSGMTESETLKTFSVTLTIMGVVGFLVTLAGATWLPLVASS